MGNQNFQARYGGSIPPPRLDSETPANRNDLKRYAEGKRGASPTSLPTFVGKSPHDERRSYTPRPLLIAALLFVAGLALDAGIDEARAVTATRFCKRTDLSPYQAINCTWPKHLRAVAKRVAECESTASVRRPLRCVIEQIHRADKLRSPGASS